MTKQARRSSSPTTSGDHRGPRAPSCATRATRSRSRPTARRRSSGSPTSASASSSPTSRCRRSTGSRSCASCSSADPDRVHHHHRPGDGRLRRAGDARGRVRLHREAAQRREAQSTQGAHPEGARQVQRPAEEPRADVASSKDSRTTASSPASPRRCATVYQIIDAVAPSTASVLILGESGTGKELVARAVHSKSERAKGPFFALNCAALPKDILENELFGHEKGAFTGSTNEKPGAFEMATAARSSSTKSAEMSPDIQVKLLRALEIAQGPPTRRQEGDHGRHPHRRRDEQGPPEGARRGRAARGSLLPSRGRRDRSAAASRARRRHSAARQRVPGALREPERQEDHRLRRRGVGVDPLVQLAGQRARAEERRRARRDHGARRQDQAVTTSCRGTCALGRSADGGDRSRSERRWPRRGGSSCSDASPRPMAISSARRRRSGCRSTACAGAGIAPWLGVVERRRRIR